MLVDMLTKISTIWRQLRSVFDGRHYVAWRMFPFGGLWSYLCRYYNRHVIRRAQKRGVACAGCTLDPQQIEAVVACEDAQLVLASAGSGKTLSLLAKIEYLAHELRIPPRQILVISFTQKTVAELKERCRFLVAHLMTFVRLTTLRALLMIICYCMRPVHVAQAARRLFVIGLITIGAIYAKKILSNCVMFPSS